MPLHLYGWCHSVTKKRKILQTALRIFKKSIQYTVVDLDNGNLKTQDFALDGSFHTPNLPHKYGQIRLKHIKIH